MVNGEPPNKLQCSFVAQSQIHTRGIFYRSGAGNESCADRDVEHVMIYHCEIKPGCVARRFYRKSTGKLRTSLLNTPLAAPARTVTFVPTAMLAVYTSSCHLSIHVAVMTLQGSFRSAAGSTESPSHIWL